MTDIRSALVELAERAFRREPPFDVIDSLGLPSMAELGLLHDEKAVAQEGNSLAHQLFLLSLTREIDSPRYDEILRRLRELEEKPRRKDRPPVVLRRDQDRKGCLRVLRRIKRELMASGWKRLKGGRFQRDIGRFFIQLWFDPGTYRSFMDIFLAAGPPWISATPRDLFDIWTEKVLFMGPPEEFEENLRKILTVVERFEQGLRELLAEGTPEPSSPQETDSSESQGAAAAEGGGEAETPRTAHGSSGNGRHPSDDNEHEGKQQVEGPDGD